MPTVLVAAAASVTVLLVYAVFEAWRADASTLHTLAEWATALGAGVLGLTALFLLVIGFPLWLVVPYLGLGGLGYAVRRRRTSVFAVVTAAGVAVCLVSMAIRGLGFALTTPAIATSALVWTAALALRLASSFKTAS